MEQYKKDYGEWENKMVEKGKKKLVRKKTIEALNLKSLKKSKKKVNIKRAKTDPLKKNKKLGKIINETNEHL